MLLILFSCTMFLSASLLFTMQPMVAKMLLPTYGGTPAVWTVCMLFFQTVLLCSYGYVWLLSRAKKPHIWRTIHTSLIALSLLFIPLYFQPQIIDGLPEWTILSNLLTQIGLPLFVIATTAPLLQFAYSQTKNQYATDPYFLYTASNLGSLIALLSYPWLIERFIGLHQQFYWWTIFYGLYVLSVLMVLYCQNYQAQTITRNQSYNLRQIVNWVLLSFIPCSLLLGVTLYSTTDMAAMPLFWVVPLALYLLTFIIAFRENLLLKETWLTGIAAIFISLSLLSFLIGTGQIPAWQIIIFHLCGFFSLALYCHRKLYLQRPNTESLTLFYFCLALGGVLAGLFNGIIAPHCFNQVYEYPFVILLSVLALPKPKQKTWLAPVTVACFSVLFLGVVSWQSKDVLTQKRSFFAVNKVQDKQGVHVFLSQSTVHGLQDMHEQKPLNGFRAYYGAVEPVVNTLKQQFPFMSVTLMGLGAGTMLCQFRDSDKVNAIEVDQQVIDIAQNTNLFTYLRDCPPAVEIIKSDGRLAVADLPQASQDLIILDAFNSDAVPTHLLTLEAFSLYKSKINRDGLILINLSNRHLHFLPVINAMGRKLNMITLHVVHKGDAKLGQFDSEWALLTSNENAAFQIMQSSNWQFVAEGKQVVWTDDYSNILPITRVS